MVKYAGVKTGLQNFVILLILSLPLSAQANAEGIKFSDLLEKAREGQTTWRQAQYNREKARLSLLGARSGFLPNLGFESSFNYDWQNQSNRSESFGSEASLVSNWSLYDNGKSLRAYLIKELEFAKAEIQEQQVINSVTYEILEKYLRHIVAKRQKEITAGRLSLLQAQYRLTERQFRQGLKTRRDYQRLESETERARLNLLRQEDAILDTFNELKRSVGIQGDAITELGFSSSSLNTLLPRFDGERDTGELKRDRVLIYRQSEIEKDIQRVRSLDAKSAIWPELGAQAKFGYGSNNFAGRGESWGPQDGFFGQGLVQLNWTLWDWNARKNTALAAQLDERLSQLKLNQADFETRLDVDKLKRDQMRLKKTLNAVRRVYEIEQSTFRDIESEYREGRASYLDMITSLDRRSQAELDVEQESVNLILNLSQFLKITGDLYETCLKL